jgi:CheY-like chemotaxis protein
MAEGGTLTLRTGAGQSADGAEPRIWVEVSDTGAGMDEETRRRCLEPFFTTKGERGTGLGLAMVYGVVQRHSGDIEIDSAAGRGTTMRLVFPARGETPLASETQPVPRVPANLRILLIDDDPVLLKSLREVLEGEGHIITTASGGQEGIDTFAASQRNAQSGPPFAVVFTDLGMPHVDGRKVAAAIRKLSVSTPIILLTGWGQRLATEGDIPPHVDHVLSKPPKLRLLREALARCFDSGGVPNRNGRDQS